MKGDESGAAAPTGKPAISDTLRVLLAELDEYLEGLPGEQLSESVLPLASSWVLEDAGFNLERYTEEARQFVEATPEHDRVLRSFPDAVTYYMALRLTMSPADEFERERARAQLEAAREAVGRRAQLLDTDFPRVAEGFRRLLEETAGAAPPDDRLWRAMALRIGERTMPRPGWSS